MNDILLAAHCEISPSTLPARSVCPCHDSGEGDAVADSGTRSHKVVETAIQLGGDEDKVRETLKTYEGLTDDEISRGVWGAAQILAIHAQTEAAAEVHTESRVDYRASTCFTLDTNAAMLGKFGTVDAWWEGANALYICDYKTYAVAMSEKDYTPQGMGYALLVASNTMRNYDRVYFNVICAGDRQIHGVSFTLDEAAAVVTPIIRRVEMLKNGGLFADGEEARRVCARPSAWCKTCAHAMGCAAIANAVSTVANDQCRTMDIPLARRMVQVPILEEYCKRVKDAVRELLQNGEQVRDDEAGVAYTLKDRLGVARLNDLRGLADALAAHGVSMDDFAAVCSVSKSAVDRLLAAANEAMPKKERELIYKHFFTAGKVQQVLTQVKL